MATKQNTFHAVLFDLDGTLIDTTQAILESLKHTIHHFIGVTPKDSELRPYMGLPLFDQFARLLPGNEDKACQVYVEHNLSIHKRCVKPFPGVTSTLKKLKAHGIKLGLVTSKRRHTAMVGLEIAGIQSIFDAMVFCDDTIKHKPDPAPILKALDILKYSLAATTYKPGSSADTSVPVQNRPNSELPEIYTNIAATTGIANTAVANIAAVAGASTYRVLMVGDSPSDINAAKNADRAFGSVVVSVQSAGVTYGAYEKDVIEQEKPDYVLDNISQVLALCGLADKV